MKKQAFTLIELLVVIGIIAILASVAMPVYRVAMRSAQQTAALANGRQIGLGLRLYAGDYEGNYPSGKNTFNEEIKTSNDAFRSLIPAYCDNEQIFVVSRSKVGPKADNKIEPETEILKAGENHFAYIMGLSSGSKSTWPLIVDSTDGSGKYSTSETAPGGTWDGTKGIVVNVDGSALLVPLRGTGNARYLPRPDDPTQDALELSAYMGDTPKLLEPAKS